MKIYASVLLKDNEIINWKTSFETVWKTVDDAMNNSQIINLIIEADGLSVEWTEFESDSIEEEFRIFNVLAPKFYSQWKMNERVKKFLFRPYKGKYIGCI